MKAFSLIFLLMLSCAFSSCADEDVSMSRAPQLDSAMSSDYSRAASSYAPEIEYSKGLSESRVQVNGNLSLEVQNVSTALEQIKAVVIQYGGKITSSDSGDSFSRYANVSALIPRESLYELIDAVKDISAKVTNENISSNDVTEEFVDVEAKLNVMKQTELRFISLLSETTNIEEVMIVERELMRLRGEIDSLEGRLQYLSRTTDNSVLNIYMVEEISIAGSGWSFFDSLDKSVRSLVSFSKHVANFLIGVIVFSPILIVALVVVLLIYKYGKKYIPRRNK
ncbi:MAG TPA: hypothetical protein DEP04_11755 [Dehalococcoidia bacterium]|nr:hypothetical protein [Dehalococcoidia bacterium]